MSEKSFFEAVATGDTVKVHLPIAGYAVGPGVDPARPLGYRVTFYWTCRCCARPFPTWELLEDLCLDCRRDGAQ